tara:strand:+ start:217 stop:1014 length:798 start_codon:yes stop_codon:yes gene_type:complete
MSWATQKNILAGTEKDFVAACQKEYKKGGKKCTKTAIEKIGTLPRLDLMFIQEVNSELEKQIMKVQPNLKDYKRAKIGMTIVSTLWNPEVFGKLIFEDSLNLTNSKKNVRPCQILVFEKTDNEFILLINAHLPHKKKFMDRAMKKIQKKIFSNKFIQEVVSNQNIKIIFGGDFNDEHTILHKNRPLIINKVKLTHIKTKKQAKKTLKSCCWKKNPKKYFSDTGDYILVNKNVKQLEIEIPKIFKKNGRKNRLFSDHMPVFSKLVI